MQQLLDAIASMPEAIRRQTTKRTIQPPEAIVMKGEEADHVYILLEGTVRVSNEFASGHRYSFAEFSGPSLIGEYEILASQPAYASTNEAITPCSIISMRADVFIQWVQHDAPLAFLLARLIAEKSYPTSNENGRIKFLSGLQKLENYLLRRFQPPAEGVFLLQEDRQQIADDIGTSVKTVNRSVAKLKKEQLIGLLHGKITITQQQYKAMQQTLQDTI